MAVEFRMLGPLEIRRDGAPLQPRGRKQKTLLALLLLEHNRVVSADQLIEALWPTGPPAGARHALEMHVSRLRSLLGDDALLAGRAPGYVLDVDPQSLDAVRFEQLAAEAQDALADDAARAATLAIDALALWRGEPLGDFTYESFAQGEIARLDELRRQTEETRFEAELALGRAEELVSELEALVAAAPLRERRRALLMRALYAAGRQADALAAYRDARTLLHDELGLEPSEELRAVERAILQQDIALAQREAARPLQERRHVTVIALEPDISLDLDPEEHGALVDDAAATVAHIAQQFDARRLDDFVLVFAHEDHAERAHAAAEALADAFPGRVGVESGEVLLADGGVRGPVIERARRRAVAGGPSAGDALLPTRRFDAPFVDRVEPLAALRERRALLLVGAPGIGKSRLLHELARTERVLVGRCSAYGADPISPLREIVAALGAPSALEGVPAAEIPLSFRRICERTPEVVFAVDDVQWADDAVLDAIARLADHDLRVVCLARDDVLTREPPLLPGLERLVLEPLAPDDAARLAAELGAADDAVVARAEGNPLFIEQLLAHSSETVDALPATLNALLAARLDRLSRAEREVVQRASVIGREFDVRLLGELLERVSPRRTLAALIRRGLLERAPTEVAFEERLRFGHALICETAYETTPRNERSRIHERLAALLDARHGGDEVVGFHLERAASLAARSDPRRPQLAEAAGRRLGAAAISAFKLGYAAHAAALFERSADLLPRDDAQRAELLCELGVAAHAAGERPRAQAALAAAHDAALAAGDERIRLRAQVEQAVLRQVENAPAAARILVERIEEALPVFERDGDDRALGRALLLRGWAEGGVFGRCRRWAEAAERALSHYRRIGFPSSTCVTQIASALYHGPTPVADALVRLQQLQAEEVDDLIGEASVLAHVGGLRAMAGEHAYAADELARARAIYEELGRPETVLLICEPLEAESALLAGDPERAASILQRNCEALRERRLWLAYATRAALRAEVLLELGRDAESARWANESQQRAVAEDAWSQIAWRAAQARRTGDVQLAREALTLARSTDLVDFEARALLAVGDAGSIAAAARLYEEKGNVVAAARAAATTPSSTS